MSLSRKIERLEGLARQLEPQESGEQRRARAERYLAMVATRDREAFGPVVRKLAQRRPLEEAEREVLRRNARVVRVMGEEALARIQSRERGAFAR